MHNNRVIESILKPSHVLDFNDGHFKNSLHSWSARKMAATFGQTDTHIEIGFRTVIKTKNPFLFQPS
jgi:hypothetical protein